MLSLVKESIVLNPTEKGVFFSENIELSIFSSLLHISRFLRRYFDIKTLALFLVVIPYNVLYNKLSLAKSMNEVLENVSSDLIQLLNVVQSYFILKSLFLSSTLLGSGLKAVK